MTPHSIKLLQVILDDLFSPYSTSGIHLIFFITRRFIQNEGLILFLGEITIVTNVTMCQFVTIYQGCLTDDIQIILCLQLMSSY